MKGRGICGEVGRRRTGEENLPKEGGLNKRNGIDNRRPTFGLHPPHSDLFSSVQHLILHLSMNCASEREESCDSIRPVGNALLSRINSRFVLQRGQQGDVSERERKKKKGADEINDCLSLSRRLVASPR